MIHYSDALSDWQEIKGGPIMTYAQELKAAGKIGCIGLSSHNPSRWQLSYRAWRWGSMFTSCFS